MTKVAGLAEIVLWVRDMEAALQFYRDRFGLEIISPPQSPIKFLRVSDPGGGIPEMIVLVPHPDPAGEFPREKAKRVLHHLAFRMDSQTLRRAARAIRVGWGGGPLWNPSCFERRADFLCGRPRRKRGRMHLS
jgi:catechol 2,3-dioxygenase-like lactoylglutathione lyase family enzyme